MANYYSNPNPTFTPYIKPYDENLLLQGSALKQSQYDTNYARIQSTLDKADELEILNPYQQQYKDTKLQEVTSKLNQISGSDFSNNALVNNALGIASTVAKDPVVSSGLLSTQKIKAQLADRKRLRKEGKYNEITEFEDNDLVNKYINSSDLNAEFQGSSTATEWFDAIKEAEAAVAAKEPDVTVQLGNYGQLERFTDKSKSRTPEQIKNILATTLQNNPRIGKMIGIIGKYNYRGVDAPTMLKHVEQSIGNIKEAYNKKIADYEKNTTINNKNTSINAQIIAQLKAERDAWTGAESDQGRIPGYFDQIKEDILNGDLDRAKATFQTHSLITDAIQKYTVNNHEVSLDVPEIVKFKEQQKQWALTYNANEREKAWQHKVKEYELKMKFDAFGNPLQVIADNAPEEGSYTVEKHEKNLATLNSAIAQKTQDLRKQWDKVTSNNPLYDPATYDPKKNGGFTLEQKKEIDFKTYVALNEKARANNVEQNIDPYYQSWYNQNRELLGKQKYYQEVKDKINQEALDKFKLSGVVLGTNTGVAINYNSPEAQIVNDISKEIETLKSTGSTYNMYLNPNDVLLNKIEKYRNNPSVYNKLRQAASKGYDDFKAVADHINNKANEVFKQRTDFIDEEIKKVGTNLNDKNLIITDKDQLDELTQAVTSMSPEALQDVATKEGDSKTRGLSVKSVGRDASNNFYVNIVDAKDKLKRVYPTAINADKYLPVHQNQYIDEQLATRGHTSYTPANALSTDNGKLSYGIDTDYKGKYVFLIGPGGTPIKTDYRDDVSKITETMNILASATNKKTKKPFTREEIVEMLNNPALVQNIQINAK